ncbi:MAG: hypothetical protein CVV52_03620 [Spirochaetae bacterium HGW-Spirochaetae-8]|nr:MAG: hypothetical protein CVV52_03620 [Spirochaetae bacterium HGW-Spirochaetae-8]
MVKLKILQTLGIFLLVAACLSAAELPSGSVSDAGNATISGSNGYIVIPSAETAWSGKNTTVTTGYSGVFTGSYAHVPYIQMGFASNLEMSLAIDISQEVDLLFGGKWRFARSQNSSMTFGMVGQMLNSTSVSRFAAQVYVNSTFNSTFIDWPSKTTLLIGYTFDGPLTSDIDFGMGYQTAFLPDVFKGKVDFLIDFGNASYSASPSGGNADSRGMLNFGLRLLPLQFLKSVYVSVDVRALDVFDAAGRALSASIAISYRAQ